jgi:hypothetical protein
MNFRVPIKNFGPVPALNFVDHLRTFIGEQEILIETPVSPIGRMFPTETLDSSGTIESSNYVLVMSRAKRLATEITIEYDWPNGHEKYCTRAEYEPLIDAFEEVGACKH